MNFQFFFNCDFDDLVKVAKIYSVLLYVSIVYSWKFRKNTGSQNIV